MAPVVHVVNDDVAFRTALARLLKAGGYQVALYQSANKFLEIPTNDGPGCILLDVRLPGLDGLELQNRLADLGNALPIVFLTGHGDVATIVKAIKAGAEDFLLKPVTKKTLLEAVERALSRYNEGREQDAKQRYYRSLVATFTPREHQVFGLVVRGKLNKQVAHALGLSVRTIKGHRHIIMQKLKVQSLAEAVSIAERLGILAAVALLDGRAERERKPEDAVSS